jgi:hypothetical protein
MNDRIRSFNTCSQHVLVNKALRFGVGSHMTSLDASLLDLELFVYPLDFNKNTKVIQNSAFIIKLFNEHVKILTTSCALFTILDVQRKMHQIHHWMMREE